MMQRNLERHDLQRTAQEAAIASKKPTPNTRFAKAGLVVAGLQRQAALIRHEFALQNLSYLRNRQLNSEQWFRLANSSSTAGLVTLTPAN